MKNLIRDKKRAGAAVILLAAAAAAIAGHGRLRGPFASGDGKGGQNMEAAGTTQTEEWIQEPLLVDGKEEALLSEIYQALEQGDPGKAAGIINENEESLRILVGETLGGKKYCYYEETDGETGTEYHKMSELTDESEAEGMVFTRYNTVFYGSFSCGKPEGACMAIQAMVLNEPRYTYADGIWSGGRMTGAGRTGYRYYENAPDTGFVMTEKAGIYKENLLDGSFTYRAETAGGERLHWEMEADSGVTVLSDGWVYYEDRREYMIPSVEDALRAYVLKEDQLNAVLWNNLILWDE